MDRMKWGRWLFVTVFGFIALMEQSSLQAQERRIAIVIGIDAYEGGMRLLKAVNDAKLIGGALESAGFEVTSLFDTRRDSVISEVEAVTKKLSRDDIFFFYFAGHGVEIGGVNYLVPVDVKSDNLQDFEASSIRLQDMFDKAKQSAAQIWVFDACRNNPYKPFKTRGLTPSLYRQQKTPELKNWLTSEAILTLASVDQNRLIRTSNGSNDISGSIVIFSSDKNSCPLEISGGAVTVFANSLAKQIRLGGDVEAATRAVRREVSEHFRGQQRTQIYSSLVGEVMFKRP